MNSNSPEPERSPHYKRWLIRGRRVAIIGVVGALASNLVFTLANGDSSPGAWILLAASATLILVGFVIGMVAFFRSRRSSAP